MNYYRSKTYDQRNVHRENTTTSAIVQLVLIYLPLVVMGVYLLMVICKHGYKYTTFFIPKRAHKLKELVQTIGRQNEDIELNDELPYRLICE